MEKFQKVYLLVKLFLCSDPERRQNISVGNRPIFLPNLLLKLSSFEDPAHLLSWLSRLIVISGLSSKMWKIRLLPSPHAVVGGLWFSLKILREKLLYMLLHFLCFPNIIELTLVVKALQRIFGIIWGEWDCLIVMKSIQFLETWNMHWRHLSSKG